MGMVNNYLKTQCMLCIYQVGFETIYDIDSHNLQTTQLRVEKKPDPSLSQGFGVCHARPRYLRV